MVHAMRSVECAVARIVAGVKLWVNTFPEPLQNTLTDKRTLQISMMFDYTWCT